LTRVFPRRTVESSRLEIAIPAVAVNIICGDPQLSSISGLAQAFFYADARSLIVSNWAVDSKSASR